MNRPQKSWDALATDPAQIRTSREKSEPLSVSVVVPVYNSQETLPLLCERLLKVLSVLGESGLQPAGMPATPGTPWEIILVNDGSKDQSWKVIRELAARYPGVQGINLMRNYGQHNAMLCGIRRANGNVIVTLDDDLQNPPEELPKLIAQIVAGSDVVYGTRDQEQHGFLRNVASQATKMALQGAMGAKTAQSVTSFRAFRTRLREAFATHQSPNVCIDVLLTWATTRFATVEVRHEPRQIGQSNYSVARLITHALNMMTGFSTLPLRFASFLGFGLTLFGVGVLAYVVGRYWLQGGSVPGFTFVASTIAIFSGAQLFALGIIGEYLARMHFRMLERPAYVVQDYAVPDYAVTESTELPGQERWAV